MITSFPSRWSHSGSSDDPEPAGRTDVWNNVKRRIGEAKSSQDVVRTVINECLRSCLDPSRYLNKFFNIAETYENEIGRIVSHHHSLVLASLGMLIYKTKADQEAKIFKAFSQDIADLSDRTPREKSINMVSFAPEMALLREIKDIRDELHTMGILFQDQIKVLEWMRDGEDDMYRGVAEEGLCFVRGIWDETRAMGDRAETTSTAVSLTQL